MRFKKIIFFYSLLLAVGIAGMKKIEHNNSTLQQSEDGISMGLLQDDLQQKYDRARVNLIKNWKEYIDKQVPQNKIREKTELSTVDRIDIPCYTKDPISFDKKYLNRSPTMRYFVENNKIEDLFAALPIATKENCYLIFDLISSTALSDSIFSAHASPTNDDYAIVKTAVKDINVRRLVQCILLANYLDIQYFFEEWSLLLPHKDISEDDISYCKKELNALHSVEVQKIARFLIPEKFNAYNLEIVLNNKVNVLDQLLYVLWYRQQGFPMSMQSGGMTDNLNRDIQKYLWWQADKNTVIFVLKNNQLREIPMEVATQSKTFKDLFAVDEPENWGGNAGVERYKEGCSPASLKSVSAQAFDILWSLLKEPSPESLEKVSEDNIMDILHFDLYLNIEVKNQYLERWRSRSTFRASYRKSGFENTSFYHLMAKILIKNFKYIDTFCCRAFMIDYFNMNYLGRCDILYPDLSLNFEGVSFVCKETKDVQICNFLIRTKDKISWRMGSEISTNRSLSKPTSTNDSERDDRDEENEFQKRIDGWIYVFLVGKELDKETEVQEPWSSLLKLPDFNIGIECEYQGNALTIKKDGQVLRYLLQDEQDSPVLHTVFPYRSNSGWIVVAVGTKKGFVEFFSCDKKMTYFLYKSKVSRNWDDIAPEIKAVTRSEDGKHVLVLWKEHKHSHCIKVLNSSEFIMNLLDSLKEHAQQDTGANEKGNLAQNKKEEEKEGVIKIAKQPKRETSNWRQWFKPTTIAGAIGAGAYALYRYFTQQSEPQEKK